MRILWHSVAPFVNCYTPDTEVLTRDGWKRIIEVGNNEEVLTLNPNTFEMEFQRPIEKYVYEYEGQMIHIRSKYIDLIVTPNHKLFIAKRRKNWREWSWRLEEAKDNVNRLYKIKRSGIWKGIRMEKVTIGDKEIPIKDFLEFLGFFLSVGYIDHNPIEGNYTVCLYQRKENLHLFRRALEKVTDRKVYTVEDKKICVRDKNLWEFCLQFEYANEKFIPKWIKDLPPDLLRIFIEAFELGDGLNTGQTRALFTSSTRLRDDLQEIIIKAGYGSSFYPVNETGVPGNFGASKHRVWRISIAKNSESKCHTGERKDKVINYSGVVTCLQVPNHILLVRRNGRALFCGNSGYGKVTRYFTSLLVKHGYDVFVCFPGDTYVMTEEGWKLLRDIVETREKVKIATLNIRTNQVEFQYPVEYVKRYYCGPLFEINNKRVKFRVTPNHKILARRGIGIGNSRPKDTITKFELIEAHLLPREFEVKRDFNWKEGTKKKFFILPQITKWRSHKTTPAKKIDMNLWLRFFGYYISEGNVYKNVHSYQISITQTRESLYFQEIEKTIKELSKVLNCSYSYTGHQFILRDKQLFKYLKQFGKDKDKFIPQEFKNLDKSQLKILLDSLMKGKGSKDKRRYSTSSKQLALDVSEIALKCGLYASIGTRERNQTIEYTVYLSRNMFTPLVINKSVLTPYNGYVYCLTVPNHIMYVMQNGSSMWSGNSAYYGVEPGGFLNFSGVHILAAKEGPFGVESAAKYARLYNTDIQILMSDWWAFSSFPKIVPYPVAYSPMDHVYYPEEIIEFTKQYYKLISLSNWQRNELKNRWGIDSYVIPHGVDLSIFKPMNKQEIKKSLGLEDKFVFGTVAANNDKEDRKFHAGMIKAMYWFLQENPDVKDIVWLYHTDPMEPRGMPLSRIVHKWGLDNIVKFKDPNITHTGISEYDLARLYNAMDVHLLTSKREGFGMPILESMACKVPNIVHEFSAPYELVKGRGWIVKSLGKGLNLETTPLNAETARPDVYDIADKIKRAYFKDKERERYSILSRQFALKFSWEDLVKQKWIPFLEEVREEIEGSRFGVSEVKDEIWKKEMEKVINGL